LAGACGIFSGIYINPVKFKSIFTHFKILEDFKMAIETIVMVSLGLYYLIGIATVSYIVVNEVKQIEAEPPKKEETIELTTFRRAEATP